MSEEQQPSLIKRFHNNPNAQKVLLILTVIYILSPFDICSEAIFGPLIGCLDDVGILLAEIVQFLVYMKNKKTAFEKKVQDSAINEKQNNNNEDNK